MSIEHRRCHVPVCDACRSEYIPPGEDYVPHYDTDDTALLAATGGGWRITTDGALFCDRCLAISSCITVGHDLTVWMPCICQGAHPDHALFGCGLLRYCRRTGCDHAETATLASLPTTDDPHTFGR